MLLNACRRNLIRRRSLNAIASALRVEGCVDRRMAVSYFDRAAPGDHSQKHRGDDAEPEFETLGSSKHC